MKVVSYTEYIQQAAKLLQTAIDDDPVQVVDQGYVMFTLRSKGIDLTTAGQKPKE